MKRYIWILAVIVTITSCNSPEREENTAVMGVQSVLWYQNSAECEALYHQGYNIATENIIDYQRKGDVDLPPAVTLDIDETVLDNSPFQVDMMQKGYSYSEEKWAEWCEKKAALPLPGVLSFTKLADSLGVSVFYVSNRKENLLGVTLQNLQQYGFPNADSAHVLLKTTTSSKDERRASISENYKIIMLLGDNLGDFNGIFDDRSEDFGKKKVREFEAEFGFRFIVFPNPMYGSWQRAAFPDGMPEEGEVLNQLRGY